MTKSRVFLGLWALAALAALAANWPQLGDPFVRHDDFPALLGDAAAYYDKTLTEGRWLNHLWVLRPFVFSSQINYLIYLAGWSLFAAAHASVALQRAGFPWKFALALLIVLTPQSFNLAQWFNTTIPSVWVVAAHALLLLARPGWAIPSLFVFVPLAFSAYPTFPFLVLATSLAADPRWRLQVAVFAAALLLAFLLTYSLNWLAHGIFGIEIGAWRDPSPAHSLADAAANLGELRDVAFLLVKSYGVGNTKAGFAILTLATLAFWLLSRHAPREAGRAVTPLALGLGLLTLNLALSGVSFPVRAAVFVWVPASYALVRAAMILARLRIGAAVGGVTLAALIGFLGLQFVRNHLILFETWQAATRRLAADIPADAERIVVYGTRWAIDGSGSATIQTERGLTGRLRYLTGRPAVSCFASPEDCADLTPPFDIRRAFAKPVIAMADGTAFIRLTTEAYAIGP
jgi:hypothetical protein